MRLVEVNPIERDDNGRVIGWPEAKPWPGDTKKLAAVATVPPEVKAANARDLDYAKHHAEHGTWRLRAKYRRGV